MRAADRKAIEAALAVADDRLNAAAMAQYVDEAERLGHRVPSFWRDLKRDRARVAKARAALNKES